MHDPLPFFARAPLATRCIGCTNPIHPNDRWPIAFLVTCCGLAPDHCLACTLAELELLDRPTDD